MPSEFWDTKASHANSEKSNVIAQLRERIKNLFQPKSKSSRLNLPHTNSSAINIAQDYQIPTHPLKSAFGEVYFGYELDEISTIISELSSVGLTHEQCVTYFQKFHPKVFEIKSLIQRLPISDWKWIIDLGVEPEIATISQYRLFDQEYSAIPKTINFLTHAQRREHFLALLNQIEKNGSLSRDSYSLRSKEENNVLGIGVTAFSPSGGGGFFAEGEAVISTNLNSAQNGYGQYIWLNLLPEVLIHDTQNFTYHGNADHLDGAHGEIGIYSPAGQEIRKQKNANEDRETALSIAKQHIETLQLQIGIDLHRPTTLCLVPQKDYDSLVVQIEALNLPTSDILFIKNQLVPFDSDSDLLANQKISAIRENPELYYQLIKHNNPAQDLVQINRMSTLLDEENIEDDPDLVGSKLNLVPKMSAKQPRQICRELIMITQKAEAWGIENSLTGLSTPELYVIVGLFRALIQTLQQNQIPQENIVSEVQRLAQVLQIDKQNLSESDKQFLNKIGIDANNFETNDTPKSFLFRTFFPLKQALAN